MLLALRTGFAIWGSATVLPRFCPSFQFCQMAELPNPNPSLETLIFGARAFFTKLCSARQRLHLCKQQWDGGQGSRRSCGLCTQVLYLVAAMLLDPVLGMALLLHPLHRASLKVADLETRFGDTLQRQVKQAITGRKFSAITAKATSVTAGSAIWMHT